MFKWRGERNTKNLQTINLNNMSFSESSTKNYTQKSTGCFKKFDII